MSSQSCVSLRVRPPSITDTTRCTPYEPEVGVDAHLDELRAERPRRRQAELVGRGRRARSVGDHAAGRPTDTDPIACASSAVAGRTSTPDGCAKSHISFGRPPNVLICRRSADGR
jgi:hypothetical protein